MYVLSFIPTVCTTKLIEILPYGTSRLKFKGIVANLIVFEPDKIT